MVQRASVLQGGPGPPLGGNTGRVAGVCQVDVVAFFFHFCFTVIMYACFCVLLCVCVSSNFFACVFQGAPAEGGGPGCADDMHKVDVVVDFVLF